MTIHVFISETAKNDCNLHGMGTGCLDSLSKRIENSQKLEIFERNNPHPVLVKKQFYGRDKRLIAFQKTIKEDTVIVLLRVLIRGSAEYTNNFEGHASAEATTAYVQAQLKEAASVEELEDFIDDRNATDPPVPLPSISTEEQSFLWEEAYPGVDDDTMVCETHEFVADLKSPAIKTQLIRIPDLVAEAIHATSGEIAIVQSKQNSGLRLVVYNSPDTKQCVLLRIFQDSPDTVESSQLEWTEKIGGANHVKILRFCRVSYPSLVCCDEQIWVALHSDDDLADGVANLSLSPEEGAILNSCNEHDGENVGFPLFINGRAGSGKSTLLQYLFAFSFRRWLTTLGISGDKSSSPLYLASSGTLLRVARTASLGILSMNSSQVLEGREMDEAAKDLHEGCFQQTSSFMHSLLTPDQARQFPLQNRVDYATFRKLWDEQFRNEKKALREYGPQVSWHIIRGLIKGFSSTELLDRDEYDSLPRDERSVSPETFQKVYKTVYENWYCKKCFDEELWDDQDLVRFLIEHDQLPRTHVAIFCDEAQDFTRVELDAIYRCSLFSNRSLDPQCVPRIPFVFAGDPFQTLNPTGFRWESVQAAFTERLLASLHQFSHFNKLPDLHYEELTFNYRSAKRIVHFCNTIQASRALLFNHSSLRPQETWRIQDDQNAPVFLEISDVKIQQSLKEQRDLVLIVPCEEGEESEYVANDSFLSKIVDLDDDAVPLNVVSAARSKGLEFKRVGLYGWSKRSEATRIAELLKANDVKEVGTDEKLQLEYFMNNLYVAASRAQRRLFVIDEGESRNGLWWIVDDEEHLHKLSGSLSSAWANQIGSMVNGGADSFQHDQDTNRRRAEQQKVEGLSTRSFFTLRQAARYFELDGNDVEANLCRGYAYRFNANFVESAKHFKQAGEIREGVLSLWEGERFTEIANLADQHPAEAGLPECVLSSFVCGPSIGSREFAETLNRTVDAISTNPEYRRRIYERSFTVSVERAISRLVSECGDSFKGVAADTVVDPLHELIAMGLEVAVETQATLHLKAENYGAVMDLLQNSKESELYKDAVALKTLNSVTGGAVVSNEDAVLVGDYLLRKSPVDVALAAEYFHRGDNLGQLRYCMEQAVEPGRCDDGQLTRVTEFVLEKLLVHRDWADLVVLLETGKLAGTKKPHGKTGQPRSTGNRRTHDLIDKANLQWKIVIPGLAQSDALSSDTGQTTHEVQRFLKQIVSDQDWRKAVSQQVMGAAIERAGKDINALEFYEKWITEGSLPAEKQHARIRWTVCKLRQAKRQGSKRNEQEAQRYMDKFGISEVDLQDEYPAVIAPPPPSTVPAIESKTADLRAEPRILPDRERVSVGTLEFNFVRDRQWVNIESEDGLRARVLIESRLVESQDTAVVRQSEDVFQCPEIRLSVEWMSNGNVTLTHNGIAWQVDGGANS